MDLSDCIFVGLIWGTSDRSHGLPTPLLQSSECAIGDDRISNKKTWTVESSSSQIFPTANQLGEVSYRIC
ncbi:MAG: hypothetical protein C5B49_13985 [Bdellovibrio sp.]|nr:MAG: hypothetical protein C5B49_13985 [Bdellovibrio sp.]